MSEKYVCFDIETLSTHKNAVVLSIGFVAFDPLVPNDDFMSLANSGLEIKFYAAEQVAKDRHVSKSTLDFWNNQGDACRRVLRPSESDIKVVDFYKALEPLGYVQDATWYCKGPHFDAAIMESLFENFKMKAPWGLQVALLHMIYPKDLFFTTQYMTPPLMRGKC
jgi:hypothetical protein